jgi:asparagine synthase (glutamine-hydrolysing)
VRFNPVRGTCWTEGYRAVLGTWQPIRKADNDLCGIAGFTHRDWSPDPDRIGSVTATLVHRGPDHQEVFESGVVSLGAARLKILDIQSGDQPILSDDGDSVIVFNGEIYNHLELRGELENLGHHFHSHCDTETVLHAFLEWDIGCFARLRGMFSVALWTESTRRLVLGRDRIGIKPLYFARRGQDLFFGSELKAIFAHPEIERQLNLNGLDCYLALNYVPCPWTLVEGVEKLPPGTWMEWRDGRVQSKPYWKLPVASPRNWSLPDACQALDSLLRQSIREHLLSDVPLGMWLSGGVDSSTILHYAATESGSRLKTFSISFRGRSFDETRYVRAMVDRYGTEHEEMDLNSDIDLIGAVEEFTYFSDEPSADAGALPVWFLSKLSRGKTTVSLSGEGADELFGGYLTYRANHLARRFRSLPASWLRLALAAIRRWPVSDEKISFEYQLKRFLEGTMMAPARGHVFWNGTFSDQQKEELLNRELPPVLNQLLAQCSQLPATDPLSRYLWFDQRYFLPDDILNKTDRMSMAHSLEVRPPFLDHRIVEFAATVPPNLKVHGRRQKILLKELMRDKLPAAVVSRPKIGFDIPAHQWLRGPFRTLLSDTLISGATEHAGLFRREVIASLLEAHLQRRANIGYHLWGLMILFLWMKKWRIQSTSLTLNNRSSTEASEPWIGQRTGTYT